MGPLLPLGHKPYRGFVGNSCFLGASLQSTGLGAAAAMGHGKGKITADIIKMAACLR